MRNTIVNVLLSTYNGEKYLKEQLESILNQKYVDVRLYIRDDGSYDKTVTIIYDYVEKYPNIYFYKENNIGCIRSFMRLIDIANGDKAHGHYFAFCDQDDVWDTDKLWYAIKMIDQQSTSQVPILYCCNLNVVDAQLNFIRLMYDSNTSPKKGNSLVFNISTGCTVVMNQELVNVYLSLNRPKYIVMHDWFFYILASFKGKVIFDSTPHIQYRQHVTNVLGARSKNLFLKGKNFMKSIFHSESDHYRELQTREMLDIMRTNITEDDLKLLQRVAFYRKNLFSRLRLILSTQVCRGLDINLRIRILFGLI